MAFIRGVTSSIAGLFLVSRGVTSIRNAIQISCMATLSDLVSIAGLASLASMASLRGVYVKI